MSRTVKSRFVLRAVVLVAVASPGACARKSLPPAAAGAGSEARAPFRVLSVQLGKAIGDDRKVRQVAAVFGPHDTIYASVATDGVTPRSTIKARWTIRDQGALVSEEGREVASAGPAVIEFHIAKQAGWPVGDYGLEIIVDGNVVLTRNFKVAKS
jgi:hypothetical protein